MPVTCFGHTCGHPQGGALPRVCHKTSWTSAQI